MGRVQTWLEGGVRAARRSTSAPPTHVLWCVCSDVRQLSLIFVFFTTHHVYTWWTAYVFLWLPCFVDHHNWSASQIGGSSLPPI